MAEVAKLVGKLVGLEMRDYQGRNGRQRTYSGLHLVHLEDSARGVKGCKVDVVSCPHNFEWQFLKLGTSYQLEYS